MCWRPLLGVPKARAEATCRAMLQPFVVDPSNRGLAYDRNRTRRALERAGVGESSPARELALTPAAGAARLPARAIAEEAVRGLSRCAVFDPSLNAWHVNLPALRASLGDRVAFNEGARTPASRSEWDCREGSPTALAVVARCARSHSLSPPSSAWSIVTSTVSGAEYRPPSASLDSLYDALVAGRGAPPPALHACEVGAAAGRVHRPL